MFNKQKLYLVFGGKLSKIGLSQFKDPDNLEITGIFDNYLNAEKCLERKISTFSG